MLTSQGLSLSSLKMYVCIMDMHTSVQGVVVTHSSWLVNWDGFHWQKNKHYLSLWNVKQKLTTTKTCCFLLPVAQLLKEPWQHFSQTPSSLATSIIFLCTATTQSTKPTSCKQLIFQIQNSCTELFLVTASVAFDHLNQFYTVCFTWLLGIYEPFTHRP